VIRAEIEAKLREAHAAIQKQLDELGDEWRVAQEEEWAQRDDEHRRPSHPTSELDRKRPYAPAEDDEIQGDSLKKYRREVDNTSRPRPTMAPHLKR